MSNVLCNDGSEVVKNSDSLLCWSDFLCPSIRTADSIINPWFIA